MSLPDNFCSAPFIQLQTGNNDRCGPCPYTPNVWKIKGKISHKWNSTEVKNLRKSFLENKKDPLCKRCWKEESSGKKSLRLRLSEFKNTKNSKTIFEKFISSKMYEKYPRVLTLVPGNECNLACPSCSGLFSSKWNSLVRQHDYTIQTEHKNWNLTDDEYQDIVDNSEKLHKIELFGGEPFLNKKNQKQLLEKIIEKGTAKNITLYFNTNGTIFDKQYIDKLINNFKFVEIRQSIDGLGKEFEYLRYGANFDQICENADKFNKLKNVDFEVICTVSIFNVLSLDKIDNFFAEKGWSVYYNIADYPNYLLLHNLPDQIKKSIILDKKFNDISKYINLKPCDLYSWNQFVKYTKELDQNRGLSFKNTFPKLYDLVKKHGYE